MKLMKIYGMRGLLEWHGTVHSGGNRMKVDFTNGSVTAYGVAPATFVTSDLLTQMIMENSDEFKSGRIRLERTVPMPGETDDRIVESKAETTVPAAKQSTETTGNKELEGEVVKEPAGEPEGTDGVQKVLVADKSEAVEWLKEHYPEEGYTAVKLRTMAAVNEAGKKHGVVFEVSAE